MYEMYTMYRRADLSAEPCWEPGLRSRGRAHVVPAKKARPGNGPLHELRHGHLGATARQYPCWCVWSRVPVGRAQGMQPQELLVPAIAALSHDLMDSFICTQGFSA